MGTLEYNNIKWGIYIKIELYPNFDTLGGDQPTDQVGFNFQNLINIQSILYSKDEFW